MAIYFVRCFNTEYGYTIHLEHGMAHGLFFRAETISHNGAVYLDILQHHHYLQCGCFILLVPGYRQEAQTILWLPIPLVMYVPMGV